MSSRPSRAGNTSTKRNSCVLKAGRDIAQSIIRSLHHDMRKTLRALAVAQLGDPPGERLRVALDAGRIHRVRPYRRRPEADGAADSRRCEVTATVS